HSNLTFSDAVLIAGDNFEIFRALKPGGTTSVSLAPKPANPFGQPLFTRIYANSQYGGPSNGSTADRESTTKSQVLSLLPTEHSPRVAGARGVVLPSEPLPCQVRRPGQLRLDEHGQPGTDLGLDPLDLDEHQLPGQRHHDAAGRCGQPQHRTHPAAYQYHQRR